MKDTTSPGFVDQPSNYLTYVHVHRRNPGLARVQRGLLLSQGDSATSGSRLCVSTS